jgi:hypothetical protein
VRHLRTLLCGGVSPGESKDTLKQRLVKAIEATVTNPLPPLGRRLTVAPERKPSARVSARVLSSGKGKRLDVTNIGTVELQKLTFELPPEASSFNVYTGDELPIDILRPGETASFIATTYMGGVSETLTCTSLDSCPMDPISSSTPRSIREVAMQLQTTPVHRR